MELHAEQSAAPESKSPSKPHPKDELKSLPMPQLLAKLGASPDGLSQAEAQKRLTQYGPNEIEEKKTNALLKFLSYFWGPIPWMIEAAVILSAVARHWPDFGIKQYQKLLEEHVAQLSSLQHLHYASNRYAILLIFQAMDAAGKDGAIRHVMSGVNPQGCQAFSFKHPSAAELEHDFLWRTTRDLPARGRIGIFNRSYYEEVLIVRVHPEILRSEGLPDALLDEKTVWHDRYRSIVDLEKHLYVNGTRIVKFYLHLSKEEQRKRFLERIDEPEKNWKFSLADIEERKFWKQYMTAYEECLSAN
jgi:PPK2 family polyphosphate:nucleotide phosphotransferase